MSPHAKSRRKKEWEMRLITVIRIESTTLSSDSGLVPNDDEDSRRTIVESKGLYTENQIDTAW
jgi:hypothetical protein